MFNIIMLYFIRVLFHLPYILGRVELRVYSRLKNQNQIICYAKRGSRNLLCVDVLLLRDVVIITFDGVEAKFLFFLQKVID